LGNGGKSRLETLEGLGVRNIQVGVPAEPEDRVNAARSIIPITWFDAEKCAVGLDRLKNYRKAWNKQRSIYTGPLHDENSHGADAFGEFAVNRQLVTLRRPAAVHQTQGGWMS